MTPEKEIILSVFNNLKYIDNNIASIIDNYIYETNEACILFGCNMEQQNKRYGKIHGKCIKYEDKDFILTNKIEHISNWKNGVLDGEYTNFWGHNGRLSYTVIYKEGLKEGDEIEYNEDGTIWTITTYKNGLKVKDYLK
jgi:antitoxin component YwqK of YwqJK toxin-antitoxin module